MLKRMYKVVSPIEKDNGAGTYWLRCGTAFVNKDNSINVYLDAIPCRTKQGEGVKLQLRELTEEELRERADKRSSYSARGALHGLPELPLGPITGASTLSTADNVPF